MRLFLVESCSVQDQQDFNQWKNDFWWGTFSPILFQDINDISYANSWSVTSRWVNLIDLPKFSTNPGLIQYIMKRSKTFILDICD